MNEMPFANLGALLTTLQAALQPLLTVPFAFFGHSTGACIAFEAARIFENAGGQSAAHLFVSGRPAPGLAMRDRPVRSLSDDDLVTTLVRYGGTPAAVMERAELMVAILPALRADLALAESVDPPAHARLSCPITIFGGAGDSIDSASLHAWSDLTTGASRVRMFSGGHFYVSGAGEALVSEIVRDLRRPAALLASRQAGAAT